jgi:hypothetical protein
MMTRVARTIIGRRVPPVNLHSTRLVTVRLLLQRTEPILDTAT